MKRGGQNGKGGNEKRRRRKERRKRADWVEGMKANKRRMWEGEKKWREKKRNRRKAGEEGKKKSRLCGGGGVAGRGVSARQKQSDRDSLMRGERKREREKRR